MITIAILNRSTVLKDAQVAPMVAALQVQVTRDFAPVWGVDAHLAFVASGQQPPAGAWQLVVLDDSDQAGALGYHEVQQSLPYGLAFARSDIQDGLQPSVTVSHELLEMLVDPWVFSVVTLDDGRGTVFGPGASELAQEVCDAVEDDSLGYHVQNVLLSDFVTPAWFGAEGSKFDFLGHCSKPYQLLSGGYIGVRHVRAGAWGQVTAQARPTRPRECGKSREPTARRCRTSRFHAAAASGGGCTVGWLGLRRLPADVVGLSIIARYSRRSRACDLYTG